MSRLTTALWRIGRSLLGAHALPDRARDLFLDATLVRDMVGEAARVKSLSSLAHSLIHGVGPDEAHIETTRALLASNQPHLARALAAGMGNENAFQLGMGLLFHDKRQFDHAWRHFARVDEESLIRLIPVEACHCALAVATARSIQVASRIGERAAELSTQAVIDLSGRFLVAGHTDLAQQLVEEAHQRPAADLDETVDGRDFTRRDVLDNIRRWTHPVVPRGSTQHSGRIHMAVIDYYQPDLARSSRNAGDYIQTLAMLSNIVRFHRVRFTGEAELGELATDLQKRVRPELQLDYGDATIHLLPISREYSEGDDVPENTWFVAFGWHMHPMFNLRYGLPYHPNLNPIFVSFHVNTIDALTPEALSYLRAHAPIGCRDWTTVDLLLGADIDAFFTGCISTTVDAIFPPLREVNREKPGVVAVIDAPAAMVKAKRPIEELTHKDPRFRDTSLAEAIRLTRELLERYQKRYRRIVTSRLHSYLPATSLGLPVKFKPARAGDVRFDGLLGLTPGAPAFVAMRDGIRDLLSSALELILAGAPRDKVYAHWRTITTSLVEEARVRHLAPLPPDPDLGALDIAAAVEKVSANARRYGPSTGRPVTDVALALDQNLAEYLPTTLESLVSNATSPLRLWILSRGLDARYEQWIADAWPDVTIVFLPFDGVEYGEVKRMLIHITVSTMDRLLLPNLLKDLDRITYVDIDTVTEGDVCELAAVDLAGYPLAARSMALSVTQQWRNAGNRLSARQASELRRTMAARHGFDFRNFNAGVLVLDLARMRADDFVATYLPFVPRFGLNDQDVLIAYAGPNHAELDERWNALEPTAEPGILHYAGRPKPWGPELVPYGDRWKRYANKVRARAGEPPAVNV